MATNTKRTPDAKKPFPMDAKAKENPDRSRTIGKFKHLSTGMTRTAKAFIRRHIISIG
jgi:hypothetical protein